MRRYALLVALLVMLCGTEARAASIGFGTLPGGAWNGSYEEDPFIVKVNTQNGGWSGGSPASHYLSSNVSQDNFYVEMIPFSDPEPDPDKNKGLIYPKFSVESLDLLSIGGDSIFTLTGHPDRDSTTNELFRFTYSVSDGTDFERILLADAARRLTSAYNGSNTSFDVDLDKVERLVIAFSHSGSVTGSVDCIVGGGGDPSTCSSRVDPNNRSVPEPASLLLLSAGLAGIGIGIWRRKATR